MPEAAAPTGPVVKDHATGVQMPVYLGGDPPIELSAADPDARGDAVVETPKDVPAKDAPAKDPPDEPPPADAAAKAEPETTAERDDKGRFITKKRFNEVNERRRIAEEELAKIKREQEAATKAKEPAAYDFDAAEARYIDLILDGKTKEAATLRREIRGAEQSQFEQVATSRAQESSRAITVEQRINAIAKDYEARIPQFDPESEHYSEEVLDDLNSVYTGLLQSKRFTDAAEAFEAAVTKTLKMHGIEDKPPAATATTEGAAPPLRTAARRIDAIKNQPPNIARSGNSSAEHGDANVRVAELSEGEFARLPEATRRRLRGDNL